MLTIGGNNGIVDTSKRLVLLCSNRAPTGGAGNLTAFRFHGPTLAERAGGERDTVVRTGRFEAAVQSCAPSSGYPTPRTAVQLQLGAAARIGWTVVTIVVVETVVCGLAFLPVVFLWSQLARWAPADAAPRLVVISLAVAPSYVLFGLLLMLASALAVRVLKWHTPAGLTARVVDMEWPLLRWVRGMVVTHIVRLVAGSVFRGSPVWTAYLRLAGARLGRRVYVNSLAVTDYNLLDFGDDVIIGDGAHLSGHTVEHGVLTTGRVVLGCHVTIGVGSLIDIDVVAGDRCQVGAMSLVPKHTRLDAGTLYVGIPVQRSPGRSHGDAALPSEEARGECL